MSDARQLTLRGGDGRALGRPTPPAIERLAKPFRLPEPDILVRLLGPGGEETCTVIYFGAGPRRLLQDLLQRLGRCPNAVRVEPDDWRLAVQDAADGRTLALIGEGLSLDQARRALIDLGQEQPL